MPMSKKFIVSYSTPVQRQAVRGIKNMFRADGLLKSGKGSPGTTA
jgi:hypothetical protein